MTGDFETWWTAHTREYRVTPKSAAKAAWDAAMEEAAKMADAWQEEWVYVTGATLSDNIRAAKASSPTQG